MIRECPCRKCVPPKRNPYCHSSCLLYIEWERDSRDFRAKKQKEEWLKKIGIIWK